MRRSNITRSMTVILPPKAKLSRRPTRSLTRFELSVLMYIKMIDSISPILFNEGHGLYAEEAKRNRHQIALGYRQLVLKPTVRLRVHTMNINHIIIPWDISHIIIPWDINHIIIPWDISHIITPWDISHIIIPWDS